MDINEVKEFLKSNEDVKKQLFSELLQDESLRPAMQPILDSAISKGIESFKEKGMQAILKDHESKVRESLNVKETPEQSRIRELTEKLDAMQKDSMKKELKMTATEYANKSGIPTDLVDYFLGNDVDSTMNNLKKLESVFKTSIQSSVEDKLKTAVRTPDNSYSTKTVDTIKNPFAKDNMNLTEQAKILKENPALAQQLKEMAK